MWRSHSAQHISAVGHSVTSWPFPHRRAACGLSTTSSKFGWPTADGMGPNMQRLNRTQASEDSGPVVFSCTALQTGEIHFNQAQPNVEWGLACIITRLKKKYKSRYPCVCSIQYSDWNSFDRTVATIVDQLFSKRCHWCLDKRLMCHIYIWK